MGAVYKLDARASTTSCSTRRRTPARRNGRSCQQAGGGIQRRSDGRAAHRARCLRRRRREAVDLFGFQGARCRKAFSRAAAAISARCRSSRAGQRFAESVSLEHLLPLDARHASQAVDHRLRRWRRMRATGLRRARLRPELHLTRCAVRRSPGCVDLWPVSADDGRRGAARCLERCRWTGSRRRRRRSVSPAKLALPKSPACCRRWTSGPGGTISAGPSIRAKGHDDPAAPARRQLSSRPSSTGA